MAGNPQARSPIGIVGQPALALVGERGVIDGAAGSGRWSLNWLVGAADRWHDPATATAGTVGHQRVGGLPIPETSLRVPGGQLVHRAWSTSDRGGGVVVVELENRSRDAVAVGLVVRAGAHERVRFDGERSVELGAGGPVLIASRPIARVVASDEYAVRSTVTTGAAAGVAGPLSGECVGLVFPLAHTARLRVAVADRRCTIEPGALDEVPRPEAVAAGWTAHLEAGARVELPDTRLADALAAARCTLLLGVDPDLSVADQALVARALARWGHRDAAAVALDGVGLPGGRRPDLRTGAAVLAAWAELGRISELGETGPAPELVAQAAHRLARRDRRDPRDPLVVTAQLAAAELLEGAGEPAAAELCRERAASVHPAAAPDRPVLPAFAAQVSDTQPAAAQLASDVRDCLVDDAVPGLVAVLAGMPDEWLGQSMAAHHMPTRAGLLSFAVRWHGPRPALLWERHGPVGEQLRAPALDPSWSSTELAGEALLGPVEPAGGLPKVVAPLPSPGTPVDDAPGDGVSFR